MAGGWSTRSLLTLITAFFELPSMHSSTSMISSDHSETHVGWLSDAALIRNVPSPYTPPQVDTYLDEIGWPARAPPAPRVASDLSSLQRLMYLHLLAFPQDTSALH